jgi:hypothetical protein
MFILSFGISILNLLVITGSVKVSLIVCALWDKVLISGNPHLLCFYVRAKLRTGSGILLPFRKYERMICIIWGYKLWRVLFFQNITQCNRLKASRRFGSLYCLFQFCLIQGINTKQIVVLNNDICLNWKLEWIELVVRKKLLNYATLAWQ